MDKLNLLASRKQKLFDVSKDIRKKIDELIDEASFVELDRYSFSKNEFYQEDAQGEGVVCGFARINDLPVYIVAQNSNVLNGGLSYSASNKICKCLDRAFEANAPVVYFFSSLGVLAGEGLKALEGAGQVLAKMQQLRDVVPQFSIAIGDVFGSSAIFSATCDYTYMLSDSCVSYASPLVLSAKAGKTFDKSAVGGVKAIAENGLTCFEVKDILEIRESISNILNILPDFSDGEVLETGDDLNRNAPNLNEKACAKCIIDAVFDKDYVVELGKGYASEVVTVIGRVGGYSVASIIFNGEDGVSINSKNIDKIKNFIYYAQDNNLPLVTFVNTLGIEESLEASNSLVMREVSNLAYALSSFEGAKINVIYGKAIGLGYTLFASRAMGVNYSFAFCNAQISPFSSEVGAQIELGVSGGDIEKVKDSYEQNEQDPINAAQNGFIDNVIEPEFVRQYLISALQMLV